MLPLREPAKYLAPTNSGQRTRAHVLWPLSVENGLSVCAATSRDGPTRWPSLKLDVRRLIDETDD